jgi:uncharacterized OB-fold protein
LYVFPACGVCRQCGARDLYDVEVKGPGSIYSYTVNHQRWLPDMEVPYGLALVEFRDYPGLRILGWVPGHQVDDLRVGGEVMVGFRETSGGFTVPTFSPQSHR